MATTYKRIKRALFWTREAWNRRYDPYVRRVAWRYWKRVFRRGRAR